MLNVQGMVSTNGIILVDDKYVGSVTECFNKVNWNEFTELPIGKGLEKEMYVMQRNA